MEVLSHGFPNQNYDVVKGPAAIIQVYFHSAAVPPEIDPLMKYAVDRAAGAVRVSCCDPTSVGEVCFQFRPLSTGGRSIPVSSVDPASVGGFRSGQARPRTETRQGAQRATSCSRPAGRPIYGVDHTMLVQFSGFAKLLCVLGSLASSTCWCTWSSACPRSCPQRDWLRQRREGEPVPLAPRLLAVAVVSRRWA